MPGEGEGENWLDSVPEQFRDAPFFKAAESPDAALQAIQNAASYMGNSIRVPGDDASEEDIKSFHDKLKEKVPGLIPKPSDDNLEELYDFLRPSSHENYRFEVPEGKEIPSDFEEFSKVAHKHGLSQKQFEGVLQDVLGSQWESQSQMEADHADAMKELGKEWGASYDQNLSTVKNFLRLTDAPEGIVDLISNNAMSPEEIKWLHSVAKSTKSAAEIMGQGDNGNPAMISPDEAQSRISEILNNPNHAYWNQSDPNHDRAVRKMVELHRFRAGDKSANPAFI
jgi:hypothetical protein